MVRAGKIGVVVGQFDRPFLLYGPGFREEGFEVPFSRGFFSVFSFSND